MSREQEDENESIARAVVIMAHQMQKQEGVLLERHLKVLEVAKLPRQ